MYRSPNDKQPARYEKGWIVDRIDATGRVTAKSPDGVYEKTMSSDELNLIQNPFVKGMDVLARRNTYDAAGNRVKGVYSYEPNWSVGSVDKESGTMVILSPDGVHEKTVSIDMMRDVQLLKSPAERQGERGKELSPAERQEIQQDLGHEAADEAGLVLGSVLPPMEANVAAAVAASQRMEAAREPERKKDQYAYLRSELPPVTRPERTQQEETDYNNMLFGDTKDQPWAKHPGFGQYVAPSEPDTPETRQRKYYDKFVTEANRQDALGTLAEAMKATPEIREILALSGLNPTAMESVDAIRENAEVRFEVAKVIAQKLDRIASDPNNDLGPRVINNSPNVLKMDDQTARKYLSRTYAVSLALKMIGGEFSTANESKGDFARNSEGTVIQGQHRHAATSALMTR